VVIAVLLGSAFTVAAMMTSDECCNSEFKPLEVQKARISGPAVVVVENPATWELEITVSNNLAPANEDREVEPENDEPLVFYSTRADGEVCCDPKHTDQNTIDDVVVKDTLPAEFELIDFSTTQGRVDLDRDEKHGTLLTWNVGDLEPQTKATFKLLVATAKRGFSLPGNYILNDGATATGLLYSTQEVLSDGPTKSIFVTVTDGYPMETPVAEAGIEQMAFDGNPVYLDGSGSYDRDGMIVEYIWYIGDDRIGWSMTVLTYLPVGVHTVTLVVKDNDQLRDSDEVTVTIYEGDAEVEGAVLTGVVRDATTRRGFDPYIVLTSREYQISTWTDFEGNYRIIGIPAGHYDVYCEAPDYQDFFGEVDIRENAEVEYIIDMIRE
jgi:hypothetical protein